MMTAQNLNYLQNLRLADVVVRLTHKVTRRPRFEKLNKLFLGEAQVHRLLAGETVTTDHDILQVEEYRG